MTACGVGRVLWRLIHLSGMGCGKILGGGERNSLDLLDLRLVMVLRSDFGLMCSVGIKL